MSTVQWVSVIFTLLGAGIPIAIVWGSTKNEIGNLRTQLSDLRNEFNRSREDQGRRIERLQSWKVATEAVRAATIGRGVPTVTVREDSENQRDE